MANINNPSSAVLLGKSGENVFFTARDPAENVELFVTKWGPSTVELVKGGLTPGAGISTIKNLTSMGDGRALFSVSSSTYGYELWITDGTSAGTVLVKDTNPGPASGSPGKIVSIGNGKFIFTASRPDTGSEAWVTDGTENGTQLIVDLVPGGGSSGPVASLNEGHGIILANVPGVGSGVFITDGTAQGTSLAVNIGCSSFGAALGTEDGRAVFNCTLPATGSELWVTDGTSAGTFMLKDIAPGTASGNVSSIHLLAPGKILFTANNGTHGIEPYYSDLTQAGTVMLMDGVAGSGGSAPDTKGAMVGNDGKFIFAFTYGSNGKEPVVSDGTPGGTKLLVDLAPGNGSSAPSQFTRLSDGRVMFTAGTVAWVTSGQQGDPQLLLPAPFDIVKSHTGFMVYDGTKVLMVGDDKYGTAGDGDLFYIDIDSIDGIRGN
nr:hypothetical protein BdHM001_36490 [Bdellovibrio sp. HM001]